MGGVILVHNLPSDDPSPSQADIGEDQVVVVEEAPLSSR
jgi:DNA repair protein RadC